VTEDGHNSSSIEQILSTDVEMITQHPVQESFSSIEQSSPLPSIVHGPSYPPLATLTLSGLLDLQCRRYGSRECVVMPWTGARWTYDNLREHSINLAKVLFDMGVRRGDRIGIMAGNSERYVALLFAATRVGAVVVVLNNTFTAIEALRALRHTSMLQFLG
jgi:non-ribosomal peptide synthetase component F